jgi:cation diffusion facilitator CzcD-associated flavoprotein CzcO
MKFWRSMPAGINLKSFAHATSVYAPARGHSFPEWCRERGLEDFEPCTMASFASYGMWMQERFVPGLEPIEVAQVAVSGDRFAITLANEERLHARRVVFATGLSHQAHMPAVLRELPHELVTHTSEHADYGRFRGQEVVIVGAGASAIEAGALVHEAGGRPQILVREGRAIFHDRLDIHRPFIERLRKPISVLGPGKKNRLLEELPFLLHLVPRRQRVRFVKNYLGPAAPWWIADRVQGLVPIWPKTHVIGAERRSDRIRLTIREEGRGERTIDADHVIAGTGYASNIDRLPFLDDGFRRRVRRTERAPTLSFNFESSIKGAYFIGPVAALSFGPLFRFVAGAKYAAPVVARHIHGPARAISHVMRSWTGGSRSTGGSVLTETIAAALPDPMGPDGSAR